MMFKTLSLAALLSLAATVRGESHTVRMVNNCQYGVPTLKQNFQTLSTGADYTANGPFPAAIAYLDTGCGGSGDGCSIIETSLINPTSPGAGSSTDISLIPPHALNVKTTFAYYNGCDGAGFSCDNFNCYDAFHKTDDYHAQVQCQVNDVDLLITFC